MINKAMMSSKWDDWCTPPELLEVIRGWKPIALDPCSNADSLVGAKVELSLPISNGLAEDWALLADGGLIYVNPPYGPDIALWTKKAALEYDSWTEVLMLLPARTDTRWFQDLAISASRVCFIRGRLRFVGGEHSAPFPSVLVYLGTDRSGFEASFAPLGKVYLP